MAVWKLLDEGFKNLPEVFLGIFGKEAFLTTINRNEPAIKSYEPAEFGFELPQEWVNYTLQRHDCSDINVGVLPLHPFILKWVKYRIEGNRESAKLMEEFINSLIAKEAL